MDIDLAALPHDAETLHLTVRKLAAERVDLVEAKAEIEHLKLIIEKLQRHQFGRRAEPLDDDQLQLGFEDLNADIARVEARLPADGSAKTSVREPRSGRASPRRRSGLRAARWSAPASGRARCPQAMGRCPARSAW